MSEQVKTLVDLAEAVEEARFAYDEAKRQASYARNDECGALNRLNAAQKAFDAAVEELRQKSPRDSDWRRDRSA
jgi:hypothetical protein